MKAASDNRLPTGGLLFCLAALAAGAAGVALCHPGLPRALRAAGWAFRGSTGLCLLFVVPGLTYLRLWRRLGWLPERADAFSVALAVCLTTVACHGASHKCIVLSGFLAEYWSMWAGALVWCLVGAIASAKWGRPFEMEWPRRIVWRGGLVAAAVVVAFAAATTPPRFAEEINYWPDKIYADFSKLNFGHTDLADAGIETAYGLEWAARRDGVYDLVGHAGTLRIVNRGHVAYPLDLKFVLQNRWQEVLIARFQLDGTAIGERELFHYVQERFRHSVTEPADFVRLWPVFDHRRDPRDRPMHLSLVAPTISVAPGAHVLRMQFETSSPCHGAGPRLTLFDMSNLTSRQFHRRLTRHFFVGDMGDIYETLDFSRNFREHWLQHSSSYHGTQFDAGGPTAINDEPPGHHFMCFLALTFIHDSIASISLLFLAELALLVLIAVQMTAWDNSSFRWFHLLPLIGVFCVCSRLCRLGLESNAPDTLFLLVWFCVMRAYLGGRRTLAAWLAALDFMIHIPTPQCVVFLGVAAWLVTRDRDGLKFVATALALIVLTTLARVPIISLAAGLQGAIVPGQATLVPGSARAELLKEIVFGHHWARLSDLVHTARDFARLVLLGSCGAIPIFALSLAFRTRRPDRGPDIKAGVLFLFGLFYYLAMSLIDFQRAHHVCPIAFPLVIATVRRLSQIEQRWARGLIFAVLLTVCAAAIAFMFVAGPDYTGTFTRFPIHAMSHPSSRRGYGFHPF